MGAARDLRGPLYRAYAPVVILLLAYYASALLLLNDVQVELSFEIIDIFLNLKLLLPLLAVVLSIYGFGWLIATNNGERPFLRVARWLRQVPFVEIALARMLPSLVVLAILQTCYLAFKVSIPKIAPFSWDRLFAEADRFIFLGVDPWVLTHNLMPTVTATKILSTLYAVWFFVVVFFFAFASIMRLDSRLRMTFILTFILSWSVGGSYLAIAFSSAGPVYMERLFGDPTFAPLMQRLAEQNDIWVIEALVVQEKLWKGYADPAVPAMGISAFPSMHLCLAMVVTQFGFGLNRKLGWCLAAFTGVVLIGSVHLGWHYAVDGIAGILLAVVFWKASDAFTRRWLGTTDGLPVRAG